MKLLSPTEIAERLSIHRRDVYRIIANLEVVRIGRRVRVAEDILEAFIASNTTRPQWDESINASEEERGGPTGPTRRPANDISTPSRPETGKSPPSDSNKPSWLRPLRRRAVSKG